MVTWSSSESSHCRDGALSCVLADRYGRDRNGRDRDRIVFDNSEVDVVGLGDESSVEGTTPDLQIANGEVHDFGVGNDTGAAATAIAIDVETAPHAGNTATERIVRIIRYAIAAWNAEAVFRAPIESAPTVTTTSHADAPINRGNAAHRSRRDGEERTTAPKRSRARACAQRSPTTTSRRPSSRCA